MSQKLVSIIQNGDEFQNFFAVNLKIQESLKLSVESSFWHFDFELSHSFGFIEIKIKKPWLNDGILENFAQGGKE